MTTRALTQTFPVTRAESALYQDSSRAVKWEGLTHSSSDDGSPLGVDAAVYNDRTVQVVGTFGTGGTLVVEGSLDGDNWATLTDPQGNALSFQSAKIEAIAEAVLYLRPRVTAGDVTTSLNVIVFMR